MGINFLAWMFPSTSFFLLKEYLRDGFCPCGSIIFVEYHMGKACRFVGYMNS